MHLYFYILLVIETRGVRVLSNFEIENEANCRTSEGDCYRIELAIIYRQFYRQLFYRQSI